MISSQEYVSRLRSILGGSKNERIKRLLKWTNIEQAQQHLKEIRLVQKELQLIKKDISLTMKDIRSSFTAMKAEIGKPGFNTAFMGGLFGKRTVGKMNALKKEELRKQENEVLSPYVSIIQIIDEMLVELDRVKLQMENWILENK